MQSDMFMFVFHFIKADTPGRSGSDMQSLYCQEQISNVWSDIGIEMWLKAYYTAGFKSA